MDSSTVHCNSAFSEESVHKSPVNQYWINLLDCIPSGKLHTFGVKLPQWGGSNTRHGSQRSWCLAVALGNLQPSLRRYAKPNSPWNVLPTSCKAQNTPHTNTYTKAYRLVVSTPHCPYAKTAVSGSEVLIIRQSRTDEMHPNGLVRLLGVGISFPWDIKKWENMMLSAGTNSRNHGHGFLDLSQRRNLRFSVMGSFNIFQPSLWGYGQGARTTLRSEMPTRTEVWMRRAWKNPIGDHRTLLRRKCMLEPAGKWRDTTYSTEMYKYNI